MGLVTIAALFGEWIIPMAIYFLVSSVGIGIDFSTPTMTLTLVLWPTIVAITTGASFFGLNGSARIQTAIAGLLLFGLSLLIVTGILGSWEMT